ncbi:MAG TPA: glycerol-3-phosphate dehydrogenase [Lentisphaeria bacterium]|nr:MAG: glycerol-3-phosphate dehydrogenase [Lentisphaerae bacterium GWF2_49_21]HBC88641.1 glycerol-3-phosphate dehydrogenase [Lentisphaeria bacterium]
MNIAVLSDGGWGTALAILLVHNGHSVRLWGPFPDYICEIRKSRENSKFLAGVKLPDGLVLCEDMKEAVEDSELVVLASPSQYMRGTLEKFSKLHSPGKQILVNVAKGIEVGSLKRMSEICDEILGKTRYCVLSGPSHAEEVAVNVPTAIVAASNDAATAEVVQKVFMNEFFRVYTSSDVVGVELGGALKNVFAIACGVIDGMKLGDNPKAALMTRGIAEMARLGVVLGGRYETFSGLSGIGDLIVTCTSRHSRNRHVGEELGRGRKINEILKEMGLVVAEGVKTSESAHSLALKNNVDTPIINEVYEELYVGKDPRRGVKDLMTRKAKKEF